MLGGEEFPTETWPGHVAGRERRANDADGPFSATRGQGVSMQKRKMSGRAPVSFGSLKHRVRGTCEPRCGGE